MKKYSQPHQTDAICRSLLQKAVRRADVNITKSAVIKLAADNDLSWLRNRLGVITFEESWREAKNLEFSLDIQNLISQYIKLASSIKNKDAAGLGSLAYELSLGDTSVLLSDDKNNREIKIVCEAVKRPDDFWRWIKSLALTDSQKLAIAHSETGFRLAGWPWDKSFAISTAYLSTFNQTSDHTLVVTKVHEAFPYWVAIDKHTPEGKKALTQCAEKFKLDRNLIGWIQFYLESAKCVGLEDSYWWKREMDWRFAKIGVSSVHARELWPDISSFLRSVVQIEETNLIQRLTKAEHHYNEEINEQTKLI